MNLSFAITVCNELSEIQRLLPFLLDNKEMLDEVVILYDSNSGSKEVEEFLRAKSVNGGFRWYPYSFDGDFSKMKNKLFDYCEKEYIFQIDADEIPSKTLMENIHQILEINEVDVIVVPRVNTVKGLTQQHIQKWGWQVNDKGWVNFPDYQMRICRNDKYIRWTRKVHEVLSGYVTISNLPPTEDYCMYHPKDIKRQIKQNEFYETL